MSAWPLTWLLTTTLGCGHTHLPLRESAANQEAAVLASGKIASIDDAINALMTRSKVPGLSIAVVKDNRLLWKKGYGLADVENSVPAQSLTAYRIASVSKPITAVAVMQLAERGRLDLDAPIQTYVANFPKKPWDITARQLLGHLSGVRNYSGSEFNGLPDNTRHYSSLSDALGIFKDDPLDHEPGTKYSYTTFGYTILGAAIEGASGVSYMEYMRENVFKPAKMTHTRADNYDIISNRAGGYTRMRVGERFAGKPPTGEVRNSDLLESSYKIPGGGLISTVEDLANFVIAFQGGALVKKETIEQMVRCQQTADGEKTPYGLGWYIDGMKGRSGVVWHGGVQKGVTSTLVMLPEKQVAVALLTNLEGGGMLGLEGLAGQIADIILENGVASTADAPGSAQKGGTLDWQASWPGTEIAVLRGTLTGDGPFTFRFRMPDGYWAHPHRHPVNAQVRVISGTYLVGMGSALDSTTAQVIPAGGEIMMEAGMLHFDGARGETVIEVSGTGPWGVTFLDPSKDPAGARAPR